MPASTTTEFAPAVPAFPAATPISAPDTVGFCLQVTPLGADEVAAWGALLGRQPAVAEVMMTGHEGEVAEFVLLTTSVARTQGQLRQLATTMQGSFTPQLCGPSRLCLRPLDRPSRAWDRAAAWVSGVSAIAR
jgi:hypothetical protein